MHSHKNPLSHHPASQEYLADVLSRNPEEPLLIMNYGAKFIPTSRRLGNNNHAIKSQKLTLLHEFVGGRYPVVSELKLPLVTQKFVAFGPGDKYRKYLLFSLPTYKMLEVDGTYGVNGIVLLDEYVQVLNPLI